MGRQVSVRYDGQETFSCAAGDRLLDAILAAGIDHRHLCGGFGFCTSCRIEVVSGSEGLSPVSPLERERLGEQAGSLRLACQAHVLGEVAVRRPISSQRFSLVQPDDDVNEDDAPDTHPA